MLLKGGVATPSTPPLDPPLQRKTDRHRVVTSANCRRPVLTNRNTDQNKKLKKLKSEKLKSQIRKKEKKRKKLKLHHFPDNLWDLVSS